MYACVHVYYDCAVYRCVRVRCRCACTCESTPALRIYVCQFMSLCCVCEYMIFSFVTLLITGGKKLRTVGKATGGKSE